MVAGGLTGIGIARGTDGTRTTTIRTMADTVPITMGLQDPRLRSPSEASVVAIGTGVVIGTGVAIGTGVDAAAGSS